MILAMHGRGRGVVAIVTLMLWVVSGPIAMAFDGCAMIGAMCEAPCGLSSYITASSVTDVAAPQPAASLQSPSPVPPAPVSLRPLTPPPKPALLSV